jgi:catechol 2,3-dioxygenase-like lactoylglutathione lyase family enzyme
MGTIVAPHHVGLHVRDLDRSVSFYRDVLGFEETFRWKPDAPYISVLTGFEDVDLHSAVLTRPEGGFFLELLDYRGGDEPHARPQVAQSGTAHLAFAVTGLDELYEAWTASGVASVSEPVTPTIGPNRGGRVVYMLDPDGNRVELIEAAGTFGDFAQASGEGEERS